MHSKCNALEIIPKSSPQPWAVEKLSSTKLVPGAKKVGDCCSRGDILNKINKQSCTVLDSDHVKEKQIQEKWGKEMSGVGVPP